MKIYFFCPAGGIGETAYVLASSRAEAKLKLSKQIKPVPKGLSQSDRFFAEYNNRVIQKMVEENEYTVQEDELFMAEFS